MLLNVASRSNRMGYEIEILRRSINRASDRFIHFFWHVSQWIEITTTILARVTLGIHYDLPFLFVRLSRLNVISIGQIWVRRWISVHPESVRSRLNRTQNARQWSYNCKLFGRKYVSFFFDHLLFACVCVCVFDSRFRSRLFRRDRISCSPLFGVEPNK